MAFLDSFFSSNMAVSVEVKARTQTATAGELGPITWTTSKTLTALYWKGGAAEAIVSEKLRAEVSAVFVFRPAECSTSDFPVNGRIYGATCGTFDIIDADDVAGQGKVIVVAVKEVN